MLSTPESLVPIPIIDIREGGPVGHATESRARAESLRDECVTWLPSIAAGLLPVMDTVTRRWLLRSSSPYGAELQAIARKLGFPESGFSTVAISGVAPRSPANKVGSRGWSGHLIGLFLGWAVARKWRECLEPLAISTT